MKITDEMLTAFRVAFDAETTRNNALNYNGSIRSGLEAAIAAAEPKQEPMTEHGFDTLRVHTGYSIANRCWFVRSYPFRTQEQAKDYAQKLRDTPSAPDVQ
jgi:hypothetical protein